MSVEEKPLAVWHKGTLRYILGRIDGSKNGYVTYEDRMHKTAINNLKYLAECGYLELFTQDKTNYVKRGTKAAPSDISPATPSL